MNAVLDSGAGTAPGPGGVATPPPAVLAGKPVGAVSAAVAILRCLSQAEEPLRLTQIVRPLGLNTSTGLNILRTLVEENLVQLDRHSKRYSLAAGLLALAAPLQDQVVQRRLGPAMQAAAHELGVTVALWQRVGQEMELQQVAESTDTMRIAFVLGRRLPMLLGAMGRLMAAREGQPPQALQPAFAQLRWARAPLFERWCEEVLQAASSGYAVDRGHVNRGVLGLAVPVEPSGPLRRVVCATWFEADTDEHRLVQVVQRLSQLALLARGEVGSSS